MGLCAEEQQGKVIGKVRTDRFLDLLLRLGTGRPERAVPSRKQQDKRCFLPLVPFLGRAAGLPVCSRAADGDLARGLDLRETPH